MGKFKKILARKIAHYGETAAAYDFAAREYAAIKLIEENKRMLSAIGGGVSPQVSDVIKNRIDELENMIKHAC